MKKVFVLTAIATLLLALLLPSCRIAPTPSPAPPAIATATPRPAQPTAPKESWEEKWNKTLAAAKTEGKVTIYTSYPSEFRTALAKGFKDKFGLEMEFVTGRGAEIREKLASERKAGLYLADVYMMGPSKPSLWEFPGTVFDPIPPVLMLPEVVDGKAWTGGKISFGDVKGEYVVFFGLAAYSHIATNINLVKTEEIRSVQDLLNPKYKGKIAMGDPTTTGAAMEWFGTMVDLFVDADFMDKLAKQEPAMTRDERQAVEWVAKEKHAILIAIKPAMVNEFINLGAPIDWAVVKETYLSPYEATVALINKAAHPEATKVFLNWLLSKEGQTLFSKVSGIQSARVDVDTSHIPRNAVRDPAKQYKVSSNADFWARQETYAQMAKKAFAAILK
jgi:iron(III) transport system substrate-binding protein